MSGSRPKLAFPAALHPWTLAGKTSLIARDPINLLLANHNVPEAETLLRAVGLSHVDKYERLSEPQWFRHELTDAHQSDASAASARQILPLGERVHARLYSPGPVAAEPGLGQYTALTAHLDLVSLNWSCLRAGTPEVASSFSKSREELAERIVNLPLPVRTLRTRTVGSVRQCDGTRVVADGRVVVVG